MKLRNKLLIIAMFVLLFNLGMLTQTLIQDKYKEIKIVYKTQQLEGFWTKDSFEFEGDWIHINVKNMSFERAMQVCKHETFHEIWAECGEANNLTYCINKHE